MSRELNLKVAQGFREAFARDPQGVWSAPGRVSVIGDHTDEQDGLGFGFGIDLRTAVAVATRSDGKITVATDLVPERAEAELATIAPSGPTASWKAYPLGMVWAVLEHGRENPPAGNVDDPDEATFLGTGLDIFLSTELPIGGGLSSSASICAALGTALSELWQLDIRPFDLARLAQRVEQEAAGAQTGLTDHVICLYSEREKDVFFDARGNDVSVIDVPNLAASQLQSVIVNTRESHRNWSSELEERRADCARAAELLGVQSLRELRLEDLEASDAEMDERTYRRARHIITEITRVLELTRVLRTDGPAAIADILDQSHASLREDYGVSTDRIEFTVDLARAHGARGARMTGSGLGGSVFALMPADAIPAFRADLAEGYAEHGWDAPELYEVSSAPGARREL